MRAACRAHTHGRTRTGAHARAHTHGRTRTGAHTHVTRTYARDAHIRTRRGPGRFAGKNGGRGETGGRGGAWNKR